MQCSIVFELQQHGKQGGRLCREVKPDLCLHGFFLAGRLQMQVQHEIGAWIETPAHALRLQLQNAGRLPEKKVGIGIEGVGGGFGDDIHAREAGVSVLTVVFAERLRAVKHHVRMMNNARISEMELQAADVTGGCQSGRHDEVAKDIGSFGGQMERRGHP